VAAYFADTSFWMALSRKRDQSNRHAVAWNQFVIRTRSIIVTTEAVLWEWLNGLSDASTRGVAAEGYRRAHADARIEVVPFQPELIDSAVQLYRTRPSQCCDAPGSHSIGHSRIADCSAPEAAGDW
jgi:predicted nucleic acid-binding protein